MKKFIHEQSAKSVDIPKEFTEFDVFLHSKTTSLQAAATDVSERANLLKLLFISVQNTNPFEVTLAVVQIGNTCEEV